MTNSSGGPPRKHHFVTQSWIKRFKAADDSLHVYDWDKGKIEVRSSKSIMLIYDLYTVEPAGALDTSTETTTLGALDGAFPRILGRLERGDLGADVRQDLAWYFAAQAMRDPSVIASYGPRSQSYALELVEALSASTYYEFKADLDAKFPGADVTEAEFNDLRSRGKAVVEGAIERAMDILATSGGTPDAPFTDLINQPTGRKLIEDALLDMDWTLKTATGDRQFILGDSGLLFDKGGLVSGVRAPLSPTQAIYLTPSSQSSPTIEAALAEDWEVGSLNAESAARARKWLVGDPAELGRYKGQVGGGSLGKA